MVDLREITGGKKRVRGKADDPLASLKQAARLAAEAICEMMADENQFCRHVYTDKSSGAVEEVLLQTRNIKHLRETIGAIRELTDAVRGLNGQLSPEAQRTLDIQLEKLRLDEKKLTQPEQGETGVVLLPEGDGDA